MPHLCVYRNRLIDVDSIYKYDIDKNSDFTCFNCNKPLKFRQSRNGDINYTEHFYHPNSNEEQNLECRKAIQNNIKRCQSEFHIMFSNFIKEENREYIRIKDCKKHVVDGYDEINELGIEFQNSDISKNDIISRENTSDIDWIFNVENQYKIKVKIGNFIVCEIPSNNWEEAIKTIKLESNIFLYTGFKEWIWLKERDSYHIEIDNKRRNVWIGYQCDFSKILETTCLENIITDQGLDYFNHISKSLSEINIVYARCKKSMEYLDEKHRNYISEYKFKKKDLIAIQSVAGSGKTTTLLNLAKKKMNEKILYLSYNKSLINEITIKIKHLKINNIIPKTFDSLLYNIFKKVKGYTPDIVQLKPQLIGNIIPWFNGKAYNIRKYYCDWFIKFCNDSNYIDMNLFCKKKISKDKPLLKTMWNKVLNNKLITYESIRKLAFINKWLKKIDKTYKLIMIDEVQDFDMTMLKMILNDTTVPKILVGDPMQSIYKFRGCINAFDHLPKERLLIEFYSTFRIGDPVCEKIREQFNNCWIISKSKNNTNFVTNFDNNDEYVYIFRSWRKLLETAELTQNIWINDFEKKKTQCIKLHEKLQYTKEDNDDTFEDDLPKYLRSLTHDKLNSLLNKIEQNIRPKNKSKIKFYTTHSYKGMEAQNIRLANDINMSEQEIYYVSITRGMNKILVD